MSTREEQAMGVERLSFEVAQAERNGFSSIQPIALHEAKSVLDALMSAQRRIRDLENQAKYRDLGS